MKIKCFFCKEPLNAFDFCTGVIPERKTPVKCHSECYMEAKK
jgi:hypothetical protein